MSQNHDSRNPCELRGQVTLIKCCPEGPITRDTVYRELERVVFRDIKYFSYGSTCMVYEAVDPVGNRRIITEFCPRRFRVSLYRASNQELRLRDDDPRRNSYLTERMLFIQKWKKQAESQTQDRLYGNNGPELYFLGQTPYLVMNYDGEPLLDFSGTKPEALLGALLHVADAIEQAHQTGLLLNDIKPDNLLFTGCGDTVVFRRLLDYGSAFTLEQMRSEEELRHIVTSTERFCSPELADWNHEALTFGSDVYSFGQTVLYLLCGMTMAEVPESTDSFFRMIWMCAPKSAPIRRLNAKDPDAFLEHLHIFMLYTSKERLMPEEHVLQWQTEPYLSGEYGVMRLRCMTDAKRMLERVWRASQPEVVLDLHLAWTVARERARSFAVAGFGNSDRDQWEMERQLFSEEMLAGYLPPDGGDVLTLEDMLDQAGSIFLEGCSGAGKSVGMRWLYSRIAREIGVNEGPSWLPVYLPMERAAASGLSLAAYVARELFGPRQDQSLGEETAVRWLFGADGPRMILLCDGINEIPRDSSAVLFLDALYDLARSADPGRLRLIISGQNKLQEFPGFLGRVFRVQAPEWEKVRRYLYSRLPVDADDRNIAERVEKLRHFISTPQQVHDLCVPHCRKSRLHPRAIPGDASRLLHDYLHSWCAKEKIHRAVCGVNAYSSGQESGEPYGELLLAQLARLSWSMTQTNEYYIKQSVLREQLRMVMLTDSEDLPALGCSYLTEVEAEQILSLVWSGVLFELDGQEMHIRHESYRDYLAAEYLAGLLNAYSEDRFPAVLMQPIPDRVLRYLLPMLHSDAIHRLCGRLKAENKNRMLKAIGRYFLETILDKRIKRRNMSILHRDDLVQAGNTMVRLVRGKPFSRKTKRRLIAGLLFDPRVLFAKEELG